MPEPEGGHTAILGLGLIGGSIALALRQRQPEQRLTGYSTSAADSEAALARGAVHRLADSVEAAVAGAELAVLATPPQLIAPLAEAICRADPEVVVTDAGSVKAEIVRQLTDSPHSHRMVPAHPVAGTEGSGFAAAVAGLFCDKYAVLTPLRQRKPQRAAAALERVEAFWQSLGCRTVLMDAAEHDAIFARASHLPHLVAWALMATVNASEAADRILEQGAGGLKDLIRVAASDPELWTQIALSNREQLLAAMQDFSAAWQQIRTLVQNGEREGLQQLLERHRLRRN